MRLIFHKDQLRGMPDGMAPEIFAKGEVKGDMIFIGKDIYRKIRIRHGLPVGLGDTVARITKRLGIKQCKGCKNRQVRLNELLPY